MLCYFLLVGGVLAAAVAGNITPSMVTPASPACMDRSGESGFQVFNQYCSRGPYTDTYNPPPYDSELTFDDATTRITFYSSRTVAVTEFDQQCQYELQQLVCFHFFPHCNKEYSAKAYVVPCTDYCVHLFETCNSFLVSQGSPKLAEFNCSKYDYDDPNRVCYGNVPTSAPTISVPPTEPCASRVNDTGYSKYQEFCRYTGSPNALTMNPPPYNPDLTFSEALNNLDVYAIDISRPSCSNDVATWCYEVLHDLICLSLFPVCQVNGDITYYAPPCYDACVQVRATCESILPQLGMPQWPTSLECHYFNHSDDGNTHKICAPLRSVSLGCTSTSTPPHSTVTTSTISPTTTSTELPGGQTSIKSTSTVSPTTSTSTTVSTATVIPTPTVTPVACHNTDNVNCAKLRVSASRSAFLTNKHYGYAIKALLEDIIMVDGYIRYVVRIKEDFNLNCTNYQFLPEDIVILNSDQTCVKCIDHDRKFIIGNTYLLMGRIIYDESQPPFYAGDWTLETIPGSGGCIIAPWTTKYDNKVCPWLNNYRSCNTRLACK